MAKREYTFPEEVTLVSVNEDTQEEHRHTSYAEFKSVHVSETYAALAVGLRPELKVILPNWDDDYHGEQRMEIGTGENAVPYRIIRAYKAEDWTAELTVTRLNYVSDSDT